MFIPYFCVLHDGHSFGLALGCCFSVPSCFEVVLMAKVWEFLESIRGLIPVQSSIIGGGKYV